MTARHPSRTLSALAAYLLLGFTSLTARADQPQGKSLGSLSCASASCHGRQEERIDADSVRRQEYIRWLESDPHAKAARTLDGEPFQRILRLVSSGHADGPPDQQVYRRCAQCHDPQGLAAAGDDPDALLTSRNIAARGIGCESCHGPAERWIAVHYERDLDREALHALGLVDTKDLEVRAMQCTNCHVGDAERDMNHDMIAAGHPPLRFELSAYHDKITRKHWSDAERIQTPHFKARVWAAGQVAAVDSALALLESRAARAASGDKLTPWPEFAEFDCFACHQRLRSAPYSPVALKAARPGIPGWQPWNLALCEQLIAGERSASTIGAVRKELGRSLVTDAGQIYKLSAEARTAFGAVKPESITHLRVLEVVEQNARDNQSWAASCQQLLAIQAAYLAWRDERHRLDPPTMLISVSRTARRFPEPGDDWERQFQDRLAALSSSLQFGSIDFEWPAFDYQGLGPARRTPATLLTADEIPATLKDLAQQLQKRATP